MKLRVLGRYGRFPLADSGTSSFLVYTDYDKYLLDMGCSSLSKLLKYADITELSAIILTHLHGDHIADFKAFTYMANIYKNEGRLKQDIVVYLPATPATIYNEIIGGNGIEYRIIKDDMVVKDNDNTLSFFRTVHPIETYGVRIEGGGKVLAYTSDTLLCDSLRKIMLNSDMTIGDACILSEKHTSKSLHLSVKELAECANNSGVKRLMLAHLPDYDLDKILSEAKIDMENSLLAEEGEEYLI